MIANAQMKRLMKEVETQETTARQIDHVQKLMWPEFVEANGCVFIADQYALSHSNQEAFEDEIAFEAFVNHVHLSGDELDETLQPLDILKMALTMGEKWQSKLQKDFPSERFLIILGFDEGEATLRFHKVRPFQAAWIDIEGIEKYEEAILVLEVG